MNSIGVYIGRFQPFHNGHKSIVEKMLRENDKSILIIGSLDTNNSSNPYSSQWRKEVIQEIFPDLEIHTLDDNPSNEIWFISLKNIIDTINVDVCNFYCGDRNNDFAIQVIDTYKHTLTPKEVRIIEIPRSITPISGTEIRRDIEKKGKKSIQGKIPKEVFKKIKAL